MGDILQEGEENSHKEYFNNLLSKQELSEFVLEKITRNLKSITKRNLSSIQVGARVVHKRNMLQGSLVPYFDVSYPVFGRKGPSINYV